MIRAVRVAPALLSAASSVALSAALCVSTAAAQAPSADYRRVIARAVEEFDTGHWPEARALFEQAHDLYPNARTLRGVGMCAFEMREYDQAVRALLYALAEPRRALTAEQRAETEALIERAMSFIGRYSVTLEPSDAQITVDDAVVSLSSRLELFVPVGSHEIVVRAAGHQTLRRRIDVHGGERDDLRLVLVAEGSTGFEDPPAAIALFVASGALLLAEPFAIGWFVDREETLGSCLDPPPGFRCDNVDSLGGQRDAAIGLSLAFGIAALGAAAVGVVVWVIARNDAEAARLACAPSLSGLFCSF